MKKTYSKLKTDRVVVSTESGVMSCSVRVSVQVGVEDYKTYNTWDTSLGAGHGSLEDGGAAWKIGFEE